MPKAFTVYVVKSDDPIVVQGVELSVRATKQEVMPAASGHEP